jgi:tetratricopeptide (TPR) repeat protein
MCREEMGIFDKFLKPNVEKMEKKKDVKGLIEALKHRETDVRKKAAEALGKIGDTKAVEPLIQALKDENLNVRLGGVAALGRIGDTKAVGPLIQALKDESIRGGAATALGEIGDARAVDPLIRALKDENLSVRDAAGKALKKRRMKKLIEGTLRQKKVEVMLKTEEFFKKGADHSKCQEWDEAISALEEAVRLSPDFAKAHQILALAYGAIMNADSAIKHYRILKRLNESLARELANTPAFALLLKMSTVLAAEAYTNDELGFSITPPDGWTIIEPSKVLSLSLSFSSSPYLLPQYFMSQRKNGGLGSF